MANYPDYETVDYHLLYGELIRTAQHRGTVTYKQLAPVVGLPTTGNYMGNRLGSILGAISQNEVNQGRPMLSAVVVKANGEVGDGFFTLAQQLDLLTSDDESAKQAFWEAEKRKIYEVWQQKYQK